MPDLTRFDTLKTTENKTKSIARYTSETHRVEQLKNEYITSLDPHLAETLILDPDPQIKGFLSDLTKPNQTKSVYYLARKHGITPVALVDAMHRYYHAGVMHQLFKAGPQTSARVIRDAVPEDTCCQRCDGRGKVRFQDERNDKGKLVLKGEVRDCPSCKGSGLVPQNGSIDAQKLILQTMGVVTKDKPAVMNLNLNFQGVESVLDEIEGMRKARKTQLTLDPEFQGLEDESDPL